MSVSDICARPVPVIPVSLITLSAAAIPVGTPHCRDHVPITAALQHQGHDRPVVRHTFASLSSEAAAPNRAAAQTADHKPETRATRIPGMLLPSRRTGATKKAYLHPPPDATFRTQVNEKGLLQHASPSFRAHPSPKT